MPRSVAGLARGRVVCRLDYSEAAFSPATRRSSKRSVKANMPANNRKAALNSEEILAADNEIRLAQGKPELHHPTVGTAVTGGCRWEHDDAAARLVDEANVIWQVQYRGAPIDTFGGSIQRHETMGDAW